MSSSLSEDSLVASTGENIDNSSDSESSETPQGIDLAKSKLLNLQYRNYVLKDTTNAEVMEDPPSPKNVNEKEIFECIEHNMEPARKRILLLSNMLVAESVPYGFIDSFQQSMHRSFLCPLCNVILLVPYTFECCGHSLCLACLKLHEMQNARIKPSISIFHTDYVVSESICIYKECAKHGAQRVFPNRALEGSITVYLANNPADVQGCSENNEQSTLLSVPSSAATPATIGTMHNHNSSSTNSFNLSVGIKSNMDVAPFMNTFKHITTGQQKNGTIIEPGLISIPVLLDFLECTIHTKKETTFCSICKRSKDAFTILGCNEELSLIRYLTDWSPAEVKAIVGDIATFFGNSVECSIYKDVKGPEYIENSWENLIQTLKIQYSMPFYPFVGAGSFISESTYCCYRCLRIVVEAVCTFYRSILSVECSGSKALKPRKRCLCGTGCRLQYTSEAHMRDYEHAGVGCRGDQSVTIFGSCD